MSSYKALKSIFAKIAHLNHLGAIAGWDEAVMMPSGGGAARAKALATLSELSHEIITAPKLKSLIEQAKQESLDTIWDHKNLELIEKAFINATCLPTQLVAEMTQARILCEQAWREHRAANDWKSFAPLLEKNIRLTKESANIRSEILGLSPYDVLIDDFSPDMRQAIIDPIFSTLKETLPKLISQAVEKQKQETVLIPTGPFAIEKQRELGLSIMQALGFNFNHGRLDTSHHPFCGGVPEDVRITTRYNQHEFITAAMGICHETGHARYEQQLPKTWLDQPVGHALGMSMHESQSLLVEMQACRTPAFMHFLAPIIIQQFGQDEAFTADNLFKLYTRVKPDFIRVDADELTYPLHIILRYEIEKGLIEGDLTVSDLPDVWDHHMQNYLGLSTKDNFKDGVMQDVHWPSNAFGYFPAYTLGAMIAAQLFKAIKAEHPNLLEEIAHGQFQTLFNWLKQHVHERASSVDTNTLLEDTTGSALSAEPLLAHLQARYLAI